MEPPMQMLLLVAISFMCVNLTNSAELFTLPEGAAVDCGSIKQPCSLEAAIELAAPHTVIRLQPGTYRGSFHITKPLRFIANGTAILDGEHVHRPLWFDGVSAHIDGVTFRNGYGERAGCVLVSNLVTYQTNNITRCHFVNCTSVGASDKVTPLVPQNADGVPQSAMDDFSGGALAVIYAMSVASQHEIIDTNFTRNYGRGSNAAGGALVTHGAGVRTDRQVGDGPTWDGPCSVYTLHLRAQGLSHYSGIYIRRRGTVAGYPVYWSNGQASDDDPRDAKNVLGACSQEGHGRWAVIRMPLDELDKLQPHELESRFCSSDMYMDPTLSTATNPAATTKWHVANYLVADGVRFQCEDVSKGCDSFLLGNIPASQANRGGVFAASGIHGGRPVFQRQETPDKQVVQYIFYCVQSSEWVVSELPPTSSEHGGESCSRGITSVVTGASHPMFVRGWQVWDEDAWVLSTGSGSINIQCIPKYAKEMCPVIQIANIPPDADTFAGPYFLTNATWNSRPVYSSRNRAHFIWFCGKFSEWVFSKDDPTTMKRGEEVCLRSLSSHRTEAISPDLIDEGYSQYINENWRTVRASMDSHCAAECPILSISEVPTLAIGQYEAIGMSFGRRLYRQRQAPHHVLLFTEEHDFSGWVIARDMNANLSSTSSDVVLRTKSQAVDPIRGAHWYTDSPKSKLKPRIHCERHRRCNSIDVSLDPSKPDVEDARHVTGSYREAKSVFGGFPVYYRRGGDGSDPRVMHYCPDQRRWYISTSVPRDAADSCSGAARSKPTAVTSPTDAMGWEVPAKKNKNKRYDLQLRCGTSVNITRMRTSAPPSHPSYARHFSPLATSITECSFEGNTALGDMGGSAAGAVFLHTGSGLSSAQQSVVLRRCDFRNNEASTLDDGALGESVGAFSAIGQSSTVMQHHYWHEVVAKNNIGRAGGFLVRGVQVLGTRVSALQNRATVSGGGYRVDQGGNLTIIGGHCSENTAAISGGCASIEPSSQMKMSRSRMSGNDALHGSGSLFDGGNIEVFGCKVDQVSEWAIAATFLTMTSTTMLCYGGKPSSVVSGFACVPDVNRPRTATAALLPLHMRTQAHSLADDSPSAAMVAGATMESPPAVPTGTAEDPMITMIKTAAVGAVLVAVWWRFFYSGGASSSTTAKRPKGANYRK